MTDEFLNLPALGEGLDQSLFFDQFKVVMKNITANLYANRNLTVILRQATEPNQAAWESAWTTQTGLAVPILPSATLIWFDNINNYVGGVYGTTHLTDGIVYSREARYPRSGHSYIKSVELTAAVSSNSAMGLNLTNHPSQSFYLPLLSDILLEYILTVGSLTGSGLYGGDFLFDGVKVGTQYLGMPATMGIQNYPSAPQQVYIAARIPDVLPGNHTVQAMLGVTGAPATAPTIAYGGTTTSGFGVRVMTIRG